MRTFISTMFIAALFAVVPRDLSAQELPFAAAKKRQELVNSFTADIHIKEFLAKGGGSGGYSSSLTKGAVFPKEDMTLESDNRITIDGRKYRYENNHPYWQVDHGLIVRKSYIKVSDNVLTKMSNPQGMGIAKEPTGIIFQNVNAGSIKDLILTPLLLSIRGNDPDLGTYMMKDLKLSNQQIPFSGVDCRIYYARNNSLSSTELWIDEANECIVRRIRHINRGFTKIQTSIDYMKQSPIGLFPVSWTITEFSSSGEVNRTTDVSLSNIRINERYPNSLFEIEFPPGYLVIDNRTQKDYRIEDDGSMRELSITGQSLSTVIPQPGFSWFHRHRSSMFLSLPILGALLLLLFLFFLRRKRYRTTQQTHSQTKV